MIMSFDLFNDPTMQGMEYALNSLSLRQQVLSDNIANAQTPGYQAQDVSFEGQLANILDGGSAATPTATGDVIESPDLTTRQDGNSVGMESQMSKMTETNLQYDALSQLTADRLSILKTAITG
jgi:flagellar basal-body rod protein FlgB